MKLEELLQTVTFILCLVASGVVLPMGLVLVSEPQFIRPLSVLPEPVIIFEASSLAGSQGWTDIARSRNGRQPCCRMPNRP
jgi:hypothetical protein